MNLKLKITQKEGTNMSSLVKQMSALKYRSKLNTQEGELSIVGIDEDDVQNVIDSIDEAFNIVGVDIVPTVEVPEPVVNEEPLEIDKMLPEKLDKPSNNHNKISSKDYVEMIFETDFSRLDKNKTIEEQIDMFLDIIGFPKTNRVVKQAFVAACEVKKINLENIIIEVHRVFNKTREEIIKAIMQEEFKKWLANYPDLRDKYPKISFTALLKIFASKVQ